MKKKQGRKCEKTDCGPIKDLYKDLKRIRDELENFKSQDNGSHLTNEEHKSRNKEEDLEDIKLENKKLKAEIQKLRSSAITVVDSSKNYENEDEMEKLRNENSQLREKMILLKAQMMTGRPEEKKEENFFKQEYEKLLIENQEFQKQTQALEPFKSQAIEQGIKLQNKERDLLELREKYEKVGVERLMLGKQVLKFKQVEAERAKLRENIANEPDSEKSNQKVKEEFINLLKEHEILGNQYAAATDEIKAAQLKITKLASEKEEIEEKFSALSISASKANEVEIMQQKLVDVELELSQLRNKMSTNLPEVAEGKNPIIKADYDKLVNSNKDLKDKLERALKQLLIIKDLKKTIDDKNTETLQLRQDLKRIQIENEDNLRKASGASENKSKISELRIQLADKLPGESSNLRQEMRKVVDENKILQEKVNEIEAIQKQNLQYKSLADLANTELVKLKLENKKIAMERDGLRLKAEKSTKYMMERNNLRVQLAKLSKITEYPNISVGGEEGAIKAEMNRLLIENGKLLKNVEITERIKKDNLAKEERIRDLESKLKASKDKIKEFEQQSSKTVESKTKDTIEKYKTENKELEKALEKERLANKALKSEVDKVTKKYDTLRERDLNDLEEKMKNLEAQHKQDILLFEKSSKEELAQREEELENSKKEIAVLTETNLALTKEKNELSSKAEILSQNIQRLEADWAKLKDAESQAIGLAEKVTQLTEEIEKERSDYVIMEKKYKDEMLQRKKLHNIIEDMKGKIRVYCRARPLSQKEQEMGSSSIINMVDEFTVKVETKHGPKAFAFDAVFGPDSSQEKVFEDTKRLIQSAVDGYNVCIFAYGQTGAGKTFTIQGSESNPGIAPRSFVEMMNILDCMTNYSFSLQCYMVELYLDTISDLLLPKEDRKNPPHLEIKEDIKGMMYIQSVTTHPITTADEARKIFDTGLNNRKTFATMMNDNSSRSHLIFSILIETVNKQTSQRALGKLSFVDLAGSERASKAGTSTERLKEGRAINKSLSALGDVISILASGGIYNLFNCFFRKRICPVQK